MQRKMSRNEKIFVSVPQNCMGYIIGKNGIHIKQLQLETNTRITSGDGSGSFFTVTGTKTDCNVAQQEIQRRVEEWKGNVGKSRSSGSQTHSKRSNNVKDTIVVQKEHVGVVIGKERTNLETIETKSGTKIRMLSDKNSKAQSGDKNIFEITGLPGNCVRAKELIKHRIITYKDKVIRRELGGDIQFVCIDVKDRNEKFQLELDGKSPKLDGHLQGQRYRIKTDKRDDESNDENEISDGTITEIEKHLSMALEKLKTNKDKELLADLWCHFGMVLVSNVDEEETEPGKTFTQVDFDQRLPKIVSNHKAENANRWRVSFEEGVDRSVQDVLPKYEDGEDSFPRLKLVHTHWRYDFGFGTPSCRNVRMKAWRGLRPGIGDEPPEEVKNILTRVFLQEEKDMKAWLCYPSVTVLRGEIMTPNSPYDCRIKLRAGSRYVTDKDSISREEDEILSDYLSHCKLDKKDDNVTLCLPDKDHEMPEGFGCNFYRQAEERMFSTSDDGEESFTVIVLDVKGWDSDGVDKRNQEQFGIRVVMNSWSEALLSSERPWTPKEILDKLKNYMKFLYLLKDHFFNGLE